MMPYASSGSARIQPVLLIQQREKLTSYLQKHHRIQLFWHLLSGSWMIQRHLYPHCILGSAAAPGSLTPVRNWFVRGSAG